ncbi:MAG: DUF362 domain-containing protein [Firmicutes bacterium]|nr:DUF362 domain-containing protein [Bacillota bacterium]
MRSKVALVRCDSYEQDKVDAAVRKAVEILGGLEEIDITKESRLVLKPNLLAKNPPEKACTTHPAVFAAVGKLLQDEGYTNLKYGDSPGNPVIKPEKIADECGLKTVADELGIPFGSFEEGVEIEFPEGRVADKFVICKEVVEADGIINVCKMKTHQLERITGAVKNTFGCVFGINKASSHARFSTAETFAKMIGDLNNLVRPKLHVMDGIVAMEGNGPQNGTPKQMGVILVSTDPVAIDGLFCHLVDLKPELVPTNVAAMEQGVGTYKDIIVITEDGEITPQEAAEKYGDKDFNVQRGKEYKGQLQAVRFLVPFLQKKPVVKESKCIGCGICVDSCPVEGKAIHVDGTAHYDYDKCIKCYCCQEMCPEDAITVKKSLLARIADRKWRV